MENVEVDRAWLFIVQRLRELFDPTATITRRCPTLNVRLAALEAASLARAHVRAQGVTRPAADPVVAGHGVATLPNVVDEAQQLLSGDVTLKLQQPEAVEPLRAALERVRPSADSLKQADLARLDALNASLSRTYLEDTFRAMEGLLLSKPQRLNDIEAVSIALVADLRSRGWSDERLRSQFKGIAETDEPFEQLQRVREALTCPPKLWPCHVAVSVGPVRGAVGSMPDIEVVDDLANVPRGAPASGTFLRLNVSSVDPHSAAETAYSRVSAILGAIAVFVPYKVGVRSPVVVVEDVGRRHAINVHPALPLERRVTPPDQVERILRSALRVVSSGMSDPVFDAIRHRQRAMKTDDMESRFMLLWLGIERLIVGTRDYGKVLEAARHIIPKAIALGKLRRDTTALAAAIDLLGLSGEQRGRLRELTNCSDINRCVDRVGLLRRLLSSEAESRKLTEIFYRKDVRIVQWYWRLSKAMQGGKGAKVADYFERSRRRIEWQTLRLYRARNNVAHAIAGPSWLGDLISHAHFYLTQLVAIAIHHRETAPGRSTADILMTRAGQYDSFVELLQSGHGHALRPEVLVRPTLLLG